MLLRRVLPLLLIAALALALAPMASAQEATPAAGANCTDTTAVRLQLKWVTQAQFAGYYAAANQGYYADECLDLTIIPGGPNVNPEQVIAGGGAEFGLDWMGSMLAARDSGSKSVNIAQVFQRSGMRELTWKDSGLTSITDLKGHIVGVWGFGNQFPLFAGLVKNGIDPNNPDDVTIFNQPFDMNAFLGHQVDAAAAMTYNEMAQVLEQVGPDNKFPLYTLDDLNVIDLNEVGTAMLEDLVFANEDWLAQPGNEETSIKFLRASFRGWIYCRDNPDDCVQYVLDAGSTLGAGHQAWMMNEINKLIWPSDNGIGIMDPALAQQTADIALNYQVITKAMDEGAYRTDLAQAAVDSLQADMPDLDVKGADWTAPTVEITANGE
jgi:NitT/TauT family transport system substrate-binding protein